MSNGSLSQRSLLSNAAITVLTRRAIGPIGDKALIMIDCEGVRK